MRPHSIVVGGTRGAGRVAVRALLREGHTVSVLGRRPPSGDDRSEEDVHWWSVDVADETTLAATLTALLDAHGPPRNLVFFQRFRGDGDAWAGEFATSLTATRRIIDATTPHLTAGTSVVFVSSIAARFVALEQGAGYHVAKAALVQMARFYAVTLGPRGIRVNSISPAIILKDENRAFYDSQPALRDALSAATPLRRLIRAEDVADVICLLCSEKAAAITGQNIVLDGGASLVSQQSLVQQHFRGGE